MRAAVATATPTSPGEGHQHDGTCGPGQLIQRILIISAEGRPKGRPRCFYGLLPRPWHGPYSLRKIHLKQWNKLPRCTDVKFATDKKKPSQYPSVSTMSETAKIILEGKTYEFPIYTGSEGEKAIDISNLRSDQTGHITLDLGYKNTGATTSAITFLDGEDGHSALPRLSRLSNWRKKASFLEVSYLLI
jgi:hypothetical protein